MRLHFDLIHRQRLNFVWHIPNRWKMFSFHVSPSGVVIANEFGDHEGQVPFTEDDEIIQALPANRADKPFAPAVCICRQLHLIATVPLQWTTLAAPDPFVELSGGRSDFRISDLLELVDLLASLSGGTA